MFNNSYASLSARRGGKRQTAALVVAAMAAVVLMASCTKGYSRFLKLPADPQIESELGWAIVTSAYAPIRKMPDSRSPELAIARKGRVFRCLARKIDPEGQDLGGFWYEYSDGPLQGWIHSADLSVFSSEEQARAASLRQE